MSDQLEFDDETARRLESFYQSGDIVRRRRLASAAVAPAPGQDVLDVGCGPGFYVAEMAAAVGAEGSVIGVDTSAAMLAAAAHRTEGMSNVTLLDGDAADLPVADASVDAALSVQVYEYVADIDAALDEMARVLRPGGRLVIWDVDWTTLSWQSSDSDRMANILKIWDEHLRHPSLPRWLAPRLSAAGFEDVEVGGHVFVNTEAGPDAYSGALIPLIEDFVVRHGAGAGEAAAWHADLDALSESNEYFFSVSQFCFTATSPV